MNKYAQNQHASKSTTLANEELRESIAEQTEKFLRSGGNISSYDMGETGIVAIKGETKKDH